MMVLNSNASLIFLVVLSTSLTYSLVHAESDVAYPAPDYEAEDTPDDQIPVDAFSLNRIFRTTNRFPSEDNSLSVVDPREQFTKRSRYYRKYPGKRQNRHYSDLYDCNPNSRETIRLLYAIHQARMGDIEHIIFCNRLRNPKGIIPNPRYVGKRNGN